MRLVSATIVAMEKEISITYSECMSLVLGMQHAMRMHHIVVCGLSGSAIFFHVTSQSY